MQQMSVKYDINVKCFSQDFRHTNKLKIVAREWCGSGDRYKFDVSLQHKTLRRHWDEM